jgi:hypothetical protein
VDVDLTHSPVAFVLRRSDGDQMVTAQVPTRDPDCVRQAWAAVQRSDQARAVDVLAVLNCWEPSASDARFIAQTFPGAEITHTFARPAPDGWEKAFDEVRRTAREATQKKQLAEVIRRTEEEQNNKLLPVLCGPSSSRGEAVMSFVAHQPLIPEKVYVTLAMTGWLPYGKIGMSWLTHHLYRELGEPPFADLLDLAAPNLGEGLNIEVNGSEYGKLLRLHHDSPTGMAGSAVVLPGFHERMSSILEADRLIVGIPCPDDLLVAGADSGLAAEEVRRMTLDSEYSDGFLGPSVLLMDPTGISLLADRPV